MSPTSSHQPSRSSAPPVASPARVAACEALRALEQPGGPPLDDALAGARERHALSPTDWRLCYQIAQGVTRHRLLLDFALAKHMKGGAESAQLPVRTALRMAAFQHLFLDRVPVHAIVNETVELVRAAGFSKQACGFANAVAHRIVEMDREALLALTDDAPPGPILRRFSIPDWIGREIEKTYGKKALRAECEALLQPAPLDLRANSMRGKTEDIQRRLSGEIKDLLAGERGVDLTAALFLPVRYSPDAIRLAVGLDISRLPCFQEGLVTPQDEAAQMVAHWVGARPGMRIADFCSAPGGKTTHLAAMMKNEGRLWALDADPWRLARVEEACPRLGIRCVELALNTPETRAQWSGPGGEPLDAALVDPPCTNLGTLRRHPDAKWRHREGDPVVMASKQMGILEYAASCVRRGGALVYSVCTFTHTETSGVIDAFLKKHTDWKRDAEFVPPDFVPAEWKTAAGDWLTRTGRDGIDGFFVARLRKSGT